MFSMLIFPPGTHRFSPEPHVRELGMPSPLFPILIIHTQVAFWENIQKELAKHELSIAKANRKDFQSTVAILPKLNQALHFKILMSRGN